MLSYAATSRWRAISDFEKQAARQSLLSGIPYTLTSPGVSLYNSRWMTVVSAIVPNFGIAIALTILGIALRVILLLLVFALLIAFTALWKSE